MDSSDFMESGFTTGTCDAMCPDAEIEERVTSKLVHRFEKVEGSLEDTSLLIKRHYRIVDTGNNAAEFFRTRVGISKTMDRLREIMDDETSSFSVRASFLQDRYRGIWKDMHVQNWKDEFRVVVLEEIARFMILADFLWCETNEGHDSDGSIFADRYDVELGIQLLNQVLVTLMELYDELRTLGRPCSNECEFRGYQIILQATPVQGRPAHPLEVHRILKACPSDVLNDLEDIVELQESFALKEWLRFFDAFKRLRFFSMALAGRMLPSIREHALKTIIRALNPKARPMPMVQLCDMLMLHEDGALSLCQAFGLTSEKAPSGAYTVDIKGLTKLRKDSVKKPPRFGCEIPDWGVLMEGYPKSRFVAQIPVEFASTLPATDFQLGMLAYPTYEVAIKEWQNLQEKNGFSEGEAIYEYQNACLETVWRSVNQVTAPRPALKEDPRPKLPTTQFPQQPKQQIFKPPAQSTTTSIPTHKATIPSPTRLERASSGGKKSEIRVASTGTGLDQPKRSVPTTPFQFSAQAPMGPPMEKQVEAEPVHEREDTSDGIQPPPTVPEMPPRFVTPKETTEEKAESSDGHASSDSNATVIDLEERARQEEEAIERERELESAKSREGEAKSIGRYRNQVMEFLKTVPEGFRVEPSHLPDMWNPATPFKEPPIVPYRFPVNFSASDFLEGVKKHPFCQPMCVPDAVFDTTWRRNRGASFEMMFKLIVLGPYTFGEPSCTSLPSYWLLNRLSSKRVGAGRDPEINQMLDKGPVLLNEWKRKFSRQHRKHVSMQHVIWQPEAHRLNKNDSYLLEESSGILAIIDDGEDMDEGLRRIEQLVKVMPRSLVVFPKLVVMSGMSGQGVSEEIVRRVKYLLDSEGFVQTPKVEVIEMMPHLTKLHGEIYEGFQNRWVEYFRARGYDAVCPESVRENWPPKMDPAMEAIVKIAEEAPARRRKVNEILDAEREKVVEAWADRLGQRMKARLEDEAVKLRAEREIETDEHFRARSRVLGSVWKRKTVPDEHSMVVSKRRRSNGSGKDVVGKETAGGSVRGKDVVDLPPLEMGYQAFLDGRFSGLSLSEKCAYLHERKENFIGKLMVGSRNQPVQCGER